MTSDSSQMTPRPVLVESRRPRGWLFGLSPTLMAVSAPSRAGSASLPGPILAGPGAGPVVQSSQSPELQNVAHSSLEGLEIVLAPVFRPAASAALEVVPSLLAARLQLEDVQGMWSIVVATSLATAAFQMDTTLATRRSAAALTARVEPASRPLQPSCCRAELR